MATRIPTRRLFPAARRVYVVLLGVLLATTACCRRSAEKGDAANVDHSLQGTTLRLLVVGDEAMAQAADGLRAEWEGQTGSTLAVSRAAKLDAGAPGPKPDAVILPAPWLPTAASADTLGPLAEIPKELIDESNVGEAKAHEGDPPKARKAWSGVYPALKLRQALWGRQTVAVPLGSPTLVCYYRADLLERLGAKPPKTWADYRKLVESLSDRAKLGQAAPPAGKPWSGAFEPLGPGWAGWTLIVRAAPYAAHRSHYSVLFRIDSMEPLIDGPPFVRALTELVEAAKFSPPEALRGDPTAARRAFWEGRAATALTWPTAADKTVLPDGETPAIGLCELPGSIDVYNVDSRTWEKRREGEDTRATVLGMAGRVGVTPAGPQSRAAAQLLLWLADDPWNRQLAPASAEATLLRTSDEKSPRAWVERPMSAQGAAAYVAVARKNFSRSQVMLAMRLPGRDEFLAALDEAVQEAVAGKQSPQQALAAAAEKWRRTCDRMGRDTLREAYRKGLGL